MRKIIPLIVVALLVLGFVFISKLGGIAKTVIETAGSEAVGTAVRVGGLDVSLASKSASMSSLSVANPPGFKTNDLLSAKAISATLGEVTSKGATIEEIVIDGMSLNYEVGPGGTNFDVLRKNLSSASHAQSSGSKANSYDVIIRKLKITHAQVIPAIAGFGTPVKLPDIVISNIGSKSNPATPVEVAAQVMNRVLATASSSVLSAGLPSMPAGAGAAANKAKGALKGLFSK